MPSTYPHLLRRADIEARTARFSHPWNPASELSGAHLSGLAGLKRTGVSLATLAPGKESFAYHSHHREEEWVYLLEGRVLARIDGDEVALEAGDFVAFPTPSVPHLLSNPYAEPATYLMGGENRQFEIADFPELDRRMVRHGESVTVYRLSDGEPFPSGNES